MDYTQIISDLKAKKYKSIYALMGEETYFIDKISDYIEAHVLSPDEKEFNLTVLYGKDVSAATVNDTARRYPMMAPYHVVIVKEAQELDRIEDLALYVKNPQPQTILVLNYKYKKIDGRKELGKLLKKKSVFFESKKLYDNQVPAWIQHYVIENGFKIEAKAAVMLCDFLGTQLSRIANEIDKLIITLKPDEKIITPEQVERNIGISKDFNNFELEDAIAQKDIFKANLIIDYFDKNPKKNPINVTLVTLFNFFSNLMVCYYAPDKSDQGIAATIGIRPYFAKKYLGAMRKYKPGKVLRIVSEIRTCDAKIKGVGNVSTSQSELLKELVYKMMH